MAHRRRSLGSERDSRLNVSTQAQLYIQQLEQRNRLKKMHDRQQETEIQRREKGFVLRFSGANEEMVEEKRRKEKESHTSSSSSSRTTRHSAGAASANRQPVSPAPERGRWSRKPVKGVSDVAANAAPSDGTSRRRSRRFGQRRKTWDKNADPDTFRSVLGCASSNNASSDEGDLYYYEDDFESDNDEIASDLEQHQETVHTDTSPMSKSNEAKHTDAEEVESASSIEVHEEDDHHHWPNSQNDGAAGNRVENHDLENHNRDQQHKHMHPQHPSRQHDSLHSQEQQTHHHSPPQTVKTEGTAPETTFSSRHERVILQAVTQNSQLRHVAPRTNKPRDAPPTKVGPSPSSDVNTDTTTTSFRTADRENALRLSTDSFIYKKLKNLQPSQQAVLLDMLEHMEANNSHPDNGESSTRLGEPGSAQHTDQRSSEQRLWETFSSEHGIQEAHDAVVPLSSLDVGTRVPVDHRPARTIPVVSEESSLNTARSSASCLNASPHEEVFDPVSVVKIAPDQGLGLSTSCVRFRFFNTWGDRSNIFGLTEIELFDAEHQKLRVDKRRMVLSQGVYDDGAAGRDATCRIVPVTDSTGDGETWRTVLYRLVNGYTKTTSSKHMWMYKVEVGDDRDERRPSSAKSGGLILDIHFKEQVVLGKIKLWNFNKGNRLASAIGVKDAQVFVSLNAFVRDNQVQHDWGLLWQGEVRKGCGNKVLDYGTAINICNPPPGRQTTNRNYSSSSSSDDKPGHDDSAVHVLSKHTEQPASRVSGNPRNRVAGNFADRDAPVSRNRSLSRSRSPKQHRAESGSTTSSYLPALNRDSSSHSMRSEPTPGIDTSSSKAGSDASRLKALPPMIRPIEMDMYDASSARGAGKRRARVNAAEPPRRTTTEVDRRRTGAGSPSSSSGSNSPASQQGRVPQVPYPPKESFDEFSGHHPTKPAGITRTHSMRSFSGRYKILERSRSRSSISTNGGESPPNRHLHHAASAEMGESKTGGADGVSLDALTRSFSQTSMDDAHAHTFQSPRKPPSRPPLAKRTSFKYGTPSRCEVVRSRSNSELTRLMQECEKLVDDDSTASLDKSFPMASPAHDVFQIPVLPRGSVLTFELVSTWGDPHYVGLNGIEVFDDRGELVQVDYPQNQCVACPADINVLPGYNDDPRTVDNLMNQSKYTCDGREMWLAPFVGSSSNSDKPNKNLVEITLNDATTISMIRMWNYNKSRIHSYRGVREVRIFLDDQLILQGEVRKAPGNLGGVDECSETILFTTDESILNEIARNDARANHFMSSEDTTLALVAAQLRELSVQRPHTNEVGSSSPQRRTGLQRSNSASSFSHPPAHVLLRPSRVKRPAESFEEALLHNNPEELSVDQLSSLLEEHDRPRTTANRAQPEEAFEEEDTKETLCDLIPFGQRLHFEVEETWGDQYYVGLTGLCVLIYTPNNNDDSGIDGDVLTHEEDAFVEHRLVHFFPPREYVEANPKDINMNGHRGDLRTLDKLTNGVNVTTGDQHMWMIPFTKASKHEIDIDLQRGQYIAGIRVWNYNKNLEDTRRGVKRLSAWVDGTALSPPGGLLLRKAPGVDLFDFGQSIFFRAPRKRDILNRSVSEDYLRMTRYCFGHGFKEELERASLHATLSQGNLHARRKVAIQQDWEPTLFPCGHVFKIALFGTYGDQYYVGLNGLEFYDGKGDRIQVSKIYAQPESLNALSPDHQDARVCQNLVNGKNYSTSSGANSWLAPLASTMQPKCDSNVIFVVFDQPKVLSMIKVWNYTKTPSRGARELVLWVDDVLTYHGELREGLDDGSDHAQTILFCDDQQLIEENIDEVHHCGRTEQQVLLINNRSVVGDNVVQRMNLDAPVDLSNRPTTSACR